MRERGTQARRARLAEAGSKPQPPKSGSGSFWPALAIAAIIAATAGWTVVAVMAFNGPSGGVAAVVSATPEESLDDEIIDESEEPIEESHEFPELEAMLPSTVDGAEMHIESWSAGLYGPGDMLTDGVTEAITVAGKTPADLHGAAAADPNSDLGTVVFVYTLGGLDPTPLRDAWIEDLKTGLPGFETAEEKVGDKTVLRGSDGDTPGAWYAYIADDKLFIIDSGDDDVARRLLGALSNGPAGSVAPPAATPTPDPSAEPSASPEPT
jgi:hypothetical protein